MKCVLIYRKIGTGSKVLALPVLYALQVATACLALQLS